MKQQAIFELFDNDINDIINTIEYQLSDTIISIVVIDYYGDNRYRVLLELVDNIDLDLLQDKLELLFEIDIEFI